MPPVFSKEANCMEKGSNYINLSVIAQDKEKEELKYTLNWGETEKLEKREEKVATSGEEVIFQIKDLDRYTNYYWRVDVSDGAQTIKGEMGTSRTYCVTTQCNGPFTQDITCIGCNGVGNIATGCTRNIKLSYLL